MANDCLIFQQGATVPLTAQFVTTPAGMPINVPDATIEIFGSGGSTVLSTTAMSGPVVTGLYYYDYVIPNSLAVSTYTVRFSGTVLGTPTAATTLLTVVAPGTSYGQTTGEARAAAALQRYIRCAQSIPVEAELGRVNGDRDQVLFSWPRWNLSNPIIRKNDRIIDAGFTTNFDDGVLVWSGTLHETDKVDASYNFRFFSQEDLIGFLNDALNLINLEPSGTNFTLDNLPDQFLGVVLHGGAANAIKALMFCIQFQKPATIFGGKDSAKDTFSNLNTLKENHEKTFEENKTKAKRTRWPQIAATAAPEFALPGGRCIYSNTKSVYLIENETITLSIEEAFVLQEQGKHLRVLALANGERCFASVGKIWKSGFKPAYEVVTQKGHSVFASKDHLFLANGKYVPLSDMHHGDTVVVLDKSGIRYDRIESINLFAFPLFMYDMEVPETRNFFADGILCHNSRWFRYLFSSNVS